MLCIKSITNPRYPCNTQNFKDTFIYFTVLAVCAVHYKAMFCTCYDKCTPNIYNSKSTPHRDKTYHITISTQHTIELHQFCHPQFLELEKDSNIQRRWG